MLHTYFHIYANIFIVSISTVVLSYAKRESLILVLLQNNFLKVEPIDSSDNNGTWCLLMYILTTYCVIIFPVCSI